MESSTWIIRRNHRLTAFGLFFAIPALLIVGYTAILPLVQVIDARDWITTRATLSEARLDTSSSGDGQTYRAVAHYHFAVDGEPFESTRISFHGGSDNLGNYQRDVANRLKSALQAGTTVPVYYDADDPAIAVLDRSLRIGMLAFTSLFGLIFGLIGGGLIWLGYRGQRVNVSPHIVDKPWLANPDWQGDTIVDDGRAQWLAMLLFAGLWNLVSWPVFALTLAGDGDHPWWVVALVTFFPGIGILILRRCLDIRRDFRASGPAILQLDPYPGRIGGCVTGNIALPGVRPGSLEALCTLSALHSVSRKKSTRETALWQQEHPAVLTPKADGACTQFRFDVPADLPSSSMGNARNRHHWRLLIELRTAEGTTFTRQFDIPVFAQPHGTYIDDPLPLDMRVAGSTNSSASVESPSPDWKGIPRRDTYPGGASLDYPMGHDPVVPASGASFGLVFTAIGSTMAWHSTGEDWVFGLMSVPFLLFGMLIGISSLIDLLSSRRVLIDALTISTEIRIPGFRTKAETISTGDISGFDFERRAGISSGRRHRLFYRVHAKLRDGSRLDVGWRIEGEARARKVISWLEANIGRVSSGSPEMTRFDSSNDNRRDAA